MSYPGFNKIPRLNRPTTVTEKIDGTNGLVWIGDVDQISDTEPTGVVFMAGSVCVRAGSRNRWLEPGKTDNYGFAGWVELHAFELLSLGPGHHFGEWWGQGIQRGYGIPDKRWSMFWEPNHGERPGCVGIVPTLGTLESLADTIGLELILGGLRARGSQASPGFDRPEGVVVTHEVSQHRYKVLLEGDEGRKGQT